MQGINLQRGFSLVELSIVLLIMGLVLGGLAMPLAVQRENSRIKDSQTQLASAAEAIEGFAIVNGFLPCPAVPASDGYASPSGGGCTAQHGFVPATTLNLTGVRNADNLLLDPWGSPIGYSISNSDADSDGNWDFTSPGEMQAVTMPLLLPDLVVCSTASGASAAACGSANVTLSDQSPLVLYSLGRDWPSFGSADQLENVGATIGGGVSGSNYPVAGNIVFVMRGRSEASGGEFDDQLLWMPANTLYHSLVEAGHLP
jgi:prepilin-type N-terminal cleavage/methylation domain-containing protein